jgi:hypothetical protein
VNPQGGVTKRLSTKVRHVDDLSAPHDDSGTSVNASIDGGGISHTRIDDFIRGIQRLGKNTIMVKNDVSKAYKNVCVAPQDWHLLGARTRQGYDFSTVLPFGGASSGDVWDDYGMSIEFASRLFAHVDFQGRYVTTTLD